MTVASPKNSLKTVFERVGVYGFGAGSSNRQKRIRYEIHDEDDTMEMVQLGANRTKNVLILMSDTGGGHRASAEAIRDAFKIEFGDEYKVLLLSSTSYLYLYIYVYINHSIWLLIICSNHPKSSIC